MHFFAYGAVCLFLAGCRKLVLPTEWFNQWFGRDACAPLNRPAQTEFRKRAVQVRNGECGVRSAPKSDFRHRPASCTEPARPVAFVAFGMRMVGRVTPSCRSSRTAEKDRRTHERAEQQRERAGFGNFSHGGGERLKRCRRVGHRHIIWPAVQTLRARRAFPNFRQVLDCGGLIIDSSAIMILAEVSGIYSPPPHTSTPLARLLLPRCHRHWPFITADGANVEFTTSLVPPVAWQTNSTPLIFINGQNVIISPISGSQQFFRLFSP